MVVLEVLRQLAMLVWEAREVLLASKPCYAVLLAQLAVPYGRRTPVGQAQEVAEHRNQTALEALPEVDHMGIRELVEVPQTGTDCRGVEVLRAEQVVCPGWEDRHQGYDTDTVRSH